MVNYDAFVIYNPYGADQEFVETMTRVLTGPSLQPAAVCAVDGTKRLW